MFELMGLGWTLESGSLKERSEGPSDTVAAKSPMEG